MRRHLIVLATLLPLAAAVPARAVPGLGLVTIYNDNFGVPHIVGETPQAMAFGAGYVIARDRLFETDVIRRLGQGRLSEIVGAGANDAQLIADMEIRREFFDRADIARQVELLPEHIKALLQAYADGFNLALAQQQANPAEQSVLFAALGYEPEPWTIEDSATVIMLFTMVFFAGEGAGGELDNAALLTDLIGEHGGDVQAALEVWDDLMLRNDPGAPAVVTKQDQPEAPFVSAAMPSPEQIALAQHPGVTEAADAWRSLLETVRSVVDRLPMPKIGSYALAATGARTAYGKGLLMGSPQAGQTAPSLFYEFGLHAPGTDCTGFTVPGLGPFIGIGWCNDHAWSLVAGNVGDQVDLYVELLCDASQPGTFGYTREGSCLPMSRRTETYVVKSTVSGQPPSVVTDTVWSTPHGPVWRFDESNGVAYVYKRAQAHRFVETFLGSYGLNFARSLAEIDAAGPHITASYNFVYADAGGNIAYRFTGFQPQRAPHIDHRLPVPGWVQGNEWHGMIPYEQMPHVVNPPSGIVHVNQGIDSKPAWWWPRSSDVFIGPFGHTAADQRTFANETGLTIERVEDLNRVIISDNDTLMPLVEHVVEGALDGVDPGSRLGQAFALFEAWRDAGFPRTRAADGTLEERAIAIFGVDYLDRERSPVWERWISRMWGGTGHGLRSPYVGRLGQTLAVIAQPDLFSRDYSDGWREKFRDALSQALQELTARFGTEEMAQWRFNAPVAAFTAIGVIAPPAMKVADHGSYSQIVDLGRRVGENIQPPGNGRADRAADIALNAATGEFPPHFTDQIELYESFRFKPMKMRASEFTANPESIDVLVYPGR